MKTILDWYKHESTASESPKFIALRASPYGWAGEGRFWALNGLIARSDNCTLDLNRKFAMASIAEKLNMTPGELQEFLEFLRDECELIEYQSGFVWTDRLLECLAEVMPDRIRKAERRGAGQESPRTGRGQIGKVHGQGADKLEKSTDKIHILESESDTDKEEEQKTACQDTNPKQAIETLASKHPELAEVALSALGGFIEKNGLDNPLS